MSRSLLVAMMLAAGIAGLDRISAAEPDTSDSLRAAIEEWLAQDDSPALLLVDESSGSCASAARLASYRREQTWIVAGLNLAMLITYLARWRELEGEELVEKVLHRAREAVRRLEVPR